MKKLFILATIALLATNTLSAQREQTVINNSLWNFSGAWGGWSYNYGSFNKDERGGYNGGIWALEFGKKFFIGGMHYKINNQRLNSNDVFNMTSNNLLLGITPLAYRPIHPIVSVALGSGKIKATGEATEDRIFAIHPAAGIEMNLARWCHIDAQMGYRIVNDSNFARYKNSDFSGLYGQVNLKFGFSWGRYKGGDRKDD